MKVVIARRQPPPDDVAALATGILAADGEWIRFSTDHAHALVYFAPDRTTGGQRAGYLLHWIESTRPGSGHGTGIMRAIAQFGAQCRATGHLVCEPDLVAWYEARGWSQLGQFHDSVAMAHYLNPLSPRVGQ